MPDLEKLEEPTDTRAPQEFSISQRILQALCFPFVFFTFFYLLPIPLHTGRSISSLPPQIINDTAISLLGNGSLPIPPVPSSSPHILEAFSLDELEDGHWVRRETPVDPETAYGGAYRTVDLPSAWTCNAPCTDKQKDEAMRERAKQVAGWEWSGKGAISQKLDAKSLILKTLESTGGLVLVGGKPSCLP
jgi:hypothetical protein